MIFGPGAHSTGAGPAPGAKVMSTNSGAVRKSGDSASPGPGSAVAPKTGATGPMKSRRRQRQKS